MNSARLNLQKSARTPKTSIQKIKNLVIKTNKDLDYTIFPKENLYIPVNVHPKIIKPSGHNFKTLAYEKFVMGKQPETQFDKNFVRDYYLQNVPEKMYLNNMIEKQLQDQTYPFNAYNLAENATKDYYTFQNKRKQYIKSTKTRAKNHCNMFVKQRKQQNQTILMQRSKWIQKIIMAIQNLAQKTFGLSNPNKQNQQQNGKQRIFLNEKKHVNIQFLQTLKNTDPITSKGILEDLRSIMLRNKQKFDDLRILYKNSNVTSSYLSQNSSISNQSSQSMVSAVSEIEKSQNQEQIINDLCDFENLKKKWKTQDVQRIKDLILFTLTKKIMINKQTQNAKRLLREGSFSKRKLIIQSPSINSKRKSQTIKKQMKIVLNKSQLNKQEQQIKQDIVKGDRFASVGSKYQKAKNYSNLFTLKQGQFKLSLNNISELNDKKVKKSTVNQSLGQQLNKIMKTGLKTTRLSLRN